MNAKISVGTSAFTMGAYADAPIPFEKVVAYLGDLGYDGLELPGDKGYGSLEDWPDAESRRKLMQFVRRAGLEISSYGADLSPAPFYSNDRDVRVQARRWFERNIEFCVDCNIPVIRVDYDRFATAEELERTAAELKALSRQEASRAAPSSRSARSAGSQSGRPPGSSRRPSARTRKGSAAVLGWLSRRNWLKRRGARSVWRVR